MALRCSPSAAAPPPPPPVIIKKYSPVLKKPLGRVLMLAHPQNHTPLLEIKSSFNNKVFEDPSEGIVCYIDDNGDITCEGYDEGPRLHRQQHVSRITCNTGDANIIDMLRRSWMLRQVVDEDEDDVAAKFSTPMDSATKSAEY